MRKNLRVCGGLLLVFGVFHILFWPLMNWPTALAYMTPGDRALMQTFNFCMAPVFFILAWIYLRMPGELQGSRLGWAVQTVPVAIFVMRALAEPVFGDLHSAESWFFIALCLGVTLVFVRPLMGSKKTC